MPLFLMSAQPVRSGNRFYKVVNLLIEMIRTLTAAMMKIERLNPVTKPPSYRGKFLSELYRMQSAVEGECSDNVVFKQSSISDYFSNKLHEFK